jgi:type III pantothenate kinase
MRKIVRDVKKTTQLRCMKTLCLDFGNSRMKAASFLNGNFEFETIVSNFDELDQLLNQHPSEQRILASVLELDQQALDQLKAHRVHMLASSSRLNFKIAVQKPDTIGADRLALMAAAAQQFPKQHILVIALGTCITYNLLDANANFLGGSISPGMQMRFRALNEQTAKLPLVEDDWNIPAVGYDTKTNLQTGVILGMTHEIDGFIDWYRHRYPEINLVLTGGHCMHFAGRLKNKIFADPNFLYQGLYALSQLNPS